MAGIAPRCFVEESMRMPDFCFEDQYDAPVAGVDEAGRGPWAGPVVAAAVVLDRAAVPEGLNDSKKLSPKRREVLFEEIVGSAKVGVGIGSVVEIDQIGVARANDLAMCRAIDDLGTVPAFVLIDGIWVPKALRRPALAVKKGDSRSMSIAAASIIAKVTRDRIMAGLDAECPGYGWIRNQGYGTAAHAEALERLGVTPHHRRSFKPVHNILCKEN